MKSLIVLVSLLTSAAAFGGECPSTDVDTILKYVGSTNQCGVAQQRAADCAYGSSIDTAIAGTAQQVCEARFASKLNAAEKAGYNSLLNRCAAKYAKEEGTMYRSMAAFCSLNVSLTYARLIWSLNQPVE
jgi:hypothetical protein